MKSMKLKNDDLINELNQLREIIINEDIKEIAMADKEVQYMVTTYGEQLINDPCYSKNLTLEHEDFTLKMKL